MKMVYDCFIFFNEIELLEIRLSLLDDSVDYFVIIESDLTFSGKFKPYNYKIAQERFSKWSHKILYFPIHQDTDGLLFQSNINSYTPTDGTWQLEFQMRNAVALVNHLINDNDIVLFSDVDEIPDPKQLRNIKTPNEPVTFQMLLHYYYLNCKCIGENRWWSGTVMISGKMFKQNTPQQLRDNRNRYKQIKNSGWHFSYLGGIEKIKHKIQSYSHAEYNRNEYLENEHILKSIQGGKDIFSRMDLSFEFTSPYSYPYRVRRYMFLNSHLLHYPKKDNFFVIFFYFIKYKHFLF